MHDIHAVSVDIERLRALLHFYARPHPLRPCLLAALGSALYYCYAISWQGDNLLASIPLLSEALLLPLGSTAARFFHTTKILYKLAVCLAFRFKLHGNPEDMIHALKYYRHLLTLPPGAMTEIDTVELADNLARLLAHNIQMGGEVSSDLAEELVHILRMSAAKDPLSEHIKSIAECVGNALVARLGQTEQRADSDHVLNLFDVAETLFPAEQCPQFCVMHGIALSMCFQQTSLFEHCRQAVVQFQKGLALLPADHVLHPLAQHGIATVLHHRFTHDKNLASLEESIHYSRVALDACPPGHPMRPVCLALLSGSLRWRHAFFGNAEFLEEADSHVQEALSQDIPEYLRVPVMNAIEESNAFIGGFQRDDSPDALAEEIRLRKERLARIPPGDSDQLDVLRTLALTCGAKFHQTGALEDLEEEIHYHNLALAASPPDHYVRRMSLFSLGKAFQKRFLLDDDDNKDVRYLEKSITCSSEALELCPRGQMSRFEPLQTLAVSLSIRSSILLQPADFEESMALFRSALDEEYAHPHAKYEIASQWASIAHTRQHPQTPLAYETAISLMQGSLTLGPTLEVQHRLLRGQWGDKLSAIPLEYASYHIEMGSLDRAVECLERGRALLWSEMRGLRIPMDQLRESGHTAAALAERFVAVSEELENIATSGQAQTSAQISQLDNPRDSGATDGGYGHLDGFGQMMDNVRRLERERGEIIDKIRLVPGFEDFLKAVPYKTLQTAAACGPVIVINHCHFRSDILIILNNSAPVLVPTAQNFYTRMKALKESLLETRSKHALESSHYQRSLRFVLQELYELVGRPVIETLRRLGIPEQSRVWWCPTSVVCSLPLHAAGPIESDDGVTRYFSDIYISSYTPTLSALIEARKGITDTVEPPSLLIIGQPNLSLPGVRQEIKVIQRLATSASSLIGANATRASVLEHLPGHRIAHFACHGTLNQVRPFDSAFILHGDERLTLLDIVRSRLPTAEFAFLSVCHAAEWTDQRTPDEALHLTAAMQYCGFRSVVGTLWAMADTDGRDLAEHFYRRLFAGEGTHGDGHRHGDGMHVGDKSVRALRDAVQRLRRKKGVTLERWVNFVHYGA
jgi:CHAT domain-containing protein